MITESLESYINRTGKTQSAVAEEIRRSPQALHNVLSRHDLYVVSDRADTIIDVGWYNSYYRRKG